MAAKSGDTATVVSLPPGHRKFHLTGNQWLSGGTTGEHCTSAADICIFMSRRGLLGGERVMSPIWPQVLEGPDPVYHHGVNLPRPVRTELVNIAFAAVSRRCDTRFLNRERRSIGSRSRRCDRPSSSSVAQCGARRNSDSQQSAL